MHKADAECPRFFITFINEYGYFLQKSPHHQTCECTCVGEGGEDEGEEGEDEGERGNGPRTAKIGQFPFPRELGQIPPPPHALRFSNPRA